MEILIKNNKKNYHEGSQRLEQVTQGGCGMFVLESIQDLTGHSLEQPHPIRSVLSWIWSIGSLDVPPNLNCSMVLIWNIFNFSVVVLLWL